jgi:signal transduction histidine kinase
VTFFVTLAAIVDLALVVFIGMRVWRSRRDGMSLRLRIFGALAIAGLAGGLMTGVYALFDEAVRTGVMPVAARIAPKVFLLSSTLLVLSAAGAAALGRRLAQSLEELTEAATRIAEGELKAPLPRGRGREARRLARALTSMRRELEGRPYAAAFLRDAWHDLKTPAAAIKATVEVLEDGALDDPEAARKFLANLRQSSEQLARTLDDLVTLARFETATLGDEEAIPVEELLRDAVDHVMPLADARNTSIGIVVGEGKLRGDRAALARALGNLLQNAVAATPGGRVRIEADESTPGRVFLDVVNEPAEVPADVRERLFERAATSRKGKGSGLGLAIARAAIEAHGGRIRFVELGPPRVRVRVDLPR